ncbi:MAG TPA: proton-conducting transporter membrane subunit [Candidatus Bipolaricaulota bacterium]
MTPTLALAAAILLPSGGALAIALLDRRPNLREAVTLITGALLVWSVVALLPSVAAGERPALDLLEVLPGLALRFELEPLGMLFALVASGLWLLTSVYSIGYLRGHHERDQTRFYAFFALAIAAAQGVALSGNLFTLFVCYEALTLTTYPLVTHHRTAEARRSGRLYLGFLLGTSMGLLLLAILWTWQLSGSLEFSAGGILAGKADGAVVGLLLALYVFGAGKAALMPFHRWLPAAMVAPTPVSALLHAVAVVKAGVFTVLKVVVYVFGIDLLEQTEANVWLMYAASITIIAASLIAMAQDDLKRRLAYSTVSQLSYIILGAALANQWGVIGGSLHIAMHAVGKITLFFCAGAVMVALGKTRVSEMDGIGRIMPVTMTAYFIGALSVIGLPPLGGVWSKWFLVLGAVQADQLFFVAVLLLGSLLTAGYLLPVAARAFFSKPMAPSLSPRGLREAPLLCVVPLCITAAGCLALFFWGQSVYDLVSQLWWSQGAP